MSISFEHSIKALESLQCFKPAPLLLLIKNWYLASYGSLVYEVVSVCSLWFIRLSNAFVFSYAEPQITNILYGWSEICDYFESYSSLINFWLTSSVNTLSFLLLNLVVILILIYCLFVNYLWFFRRFYKSSLLFSDWFILFSSSVASKQCW